MRLLMPLLAALFVVLPGRLAVPSDAAAQEPPTTDGAADAGRRGNALYERGAYGEAAKAYRAGLAQVADTTGAVYVRLQNNLGAALYRQEKFDAARQAFQRAARLSPDPGDRIRGLYNAGNAAARSGAYAAALDRYRQVLRLQPTHEAARYNYEFLQRERSQRQQQRQQPDEPPDVTPSPYAKQLKQEADALAAERRYGTALRMMQDGLAKDSTVAAYQKFMTRLEDVATIQRMATPSRRPGRSLRTRPAPDTRSPSGSPPDLR